VSKAKDESDLWQRVVKDVRPLRAKPKRAAMPKPAAAKPVKAKPVAEKTAKAKPAVKPAPLPALSPGQAPGFDKRSHEKFREGKMPIEARIDLHGHTLTAAHDALVAFVNSVWERDKRMLLVITGKGGRGREELGSPRATLRESVPRWLNEPSLRRRILAIGEAKAKHGGSGALYVLLKRKRG